jgi:pimeloyl-ACP methyl ester carboxylesterase
MSEPSAAKRHTRWLRAALVPLTLALLVPPVAGTPASAGTPAPAAVAAPTLSWTDCGDGLQCATMPVPLDYDKPHGPTITVAVSRLPAADPQRRIGSLFVNPGGPGESGAEYVRSSSNRYPAEVRARFDIVGMDPRGVGQSTPVRCFDSAAQEATFAADYPAVPIGAAQERRAARKSAELAARCWARSAWLLPHLSTANVARDLDLLRAAVGDQRLTYAGYSYGSYLGVTYANMFPGRIRAMVADAVVNPTGYGPAQPGLLNLNPFLRIRSDVGTGETFQQFLRICATTAACALRGGNGPHARFDALTRKLRAAPIEVGEGPQTVRIGYGELVLITTIMLYRQELWAFGAQLMADLERGDGTLAAPIVSGFSTDPVVDAQIAILCSEGETSGPPHVVAAAARAADRRTPYFGRYWAYAGQVCASWPRLDPDRYRGPWNRRTAAPILFVSTRYDPATAYHNAVETNQLMPGSRLLTVQGYAHAGFGAPSSCALKAVADYLIARTLPPAGTVCPIDVQPFEGDTASRSASASWGNRWSPW